MFKVTSTVSFLNADGTEAKPANVRTWDGLEKAGVVVDLESGYLRVMGKMNAMSIDAINGKVRPMKTTNPLTMVWATRVEEDGKLWTSATTTWPNMGDEQQAWFLGLLDGEMVHVSSDTRHKEKRGQGHGH